MLGERSVELRKTGRVAVQQQSLDVDASRPSDRQGDSRSARSGSGASGSSRSSANASARTSGVEGRFATSERARPTAQRRRYRVRLRASRAPIHARCREHHHLLEIGEGSDRSDDGDPCSELWYGGDEKRERSADRDTDEADPPGAGLSSVGCRRSRTRRLMRASRATAVLLQCREDRGRRRHGLPAPASPRTGARRGGPARRAWHRSRTGSPAREAAFSAARPRMASRRALLPRGRRPSRPRGASSGSRGCRRGRLRRERERAADRAG